MQPPFDIKPLLETALAEDIGSGDVTSLATIPEAMTARFVMRSRGEMVAAGLVFLPELFALVDGSVKVEILAEEGARVAPGTSLAILSGSARALLAGERVALNLVQQLSGVATLTRRYVDAVAGTGAEILDTRKTIPGLRALQKHAVKCGGGTNHRMGLYDAVLIKDNHIAVAGGVTAAVKAARTHISAVIPSDDGIRADSVIGRGDILTIEVECDTLDQLDEALAAGADSVLLDNMSNAQLRDAVAKVRAHNAATGVRVTTEASGNVSLETVRAIAETGVDAISVGKLTHSAAAVDIGLDEW